MKYKKLSFFTLEQIEKKKTEKITIDISNLYLKQKENNQQLKLLVEYEKEYITKINKKLISGMFSYQWKNYRNFLAVLDSIIQDSRRILEDNEKNIEKKIKVWSENQKKIKIWKYLNALDNKKTLKIKKIREQTLNDHYVQLKYFTKG